jgi:uncharacterized protein YbjT (DUF2867 family)
MNKKAIVIGATGLIGSDLVLKLLDHPNYASVLVIGRRAIPTRHQKLIQLVVDFDNIDSHFQEINGDEVFCCMGTTKKQTPDEVEYRKIDYQYPLDVARIALANGAKQYHLVSSMGANINSSIFYSRTKGEVERELSQLPFESISIYRPSLLVGNRKQKRPSEKLMIGLMRFLNSLLIGKLRKYRSIAIEKVANAMLNQAQLGIKGVHIYESNAIDKLGTQKYSPKN